MILGALLAVAPLALFYLALRLNRLRFREEGTLDLRVAVYLRLLQMRKRWRPDALDPAHLEERRGELESLARRFAGGGPRMALEQDLEIPGPGGPVPARHYRRAPGGAPRPILLYLHGGSFALGSIDTHNNVCRALAAAADCNVLSVGYRLAPEHSFPAAVEDAYAALCWAAREGASLDGDPERLAVAGDSAGGSLAAALCLMARDRDYPSLRHQALVYPATDATTIDRDSYRLYGETYVLDTAEVLWAREQYLPDPEDRRLPYASPLLAERHEDLPSATIVTAEFDVLRDEGRAYAEALQQAGVRVNYLCVRGVAHAFFSAQRGLPQARRVTRLIAADLSESWNR
jgi:acetyl esterase